MPKSLVHRKTAAALDRAREQITLRLLVSNAKRTVAELAAAERRLLSIRDSRSRLATREAAPRHKGAGGTRQMDDLATG